MNTPLIQWIYSLFSAFIGGASTAITNTLLAPESFNFNTPDGLKKLAVAAALQGGVAAAFYLKQSPLPYYDFEGGTRKSPTTTVNAVTVVESTNPEAGKNVADNNSKTGVLPTLLIGGGVIGGLLLGGCASATSPGVQTQVLVRSAFSIAAFEASQKFTDAEKANYKAFLTKVAIAVRSLKGQDGITPTKLVNTITLFAGDFIKGPNASRYKFYLTQVSSIWESIQTPNADPNTPGSFDALLETLAASADQVSNSL